MISTLNKFMFGASNTEFFVQSLQTGGQFGVCSEPGLEARILFAVNWPIGFYAHWDSRQDNSGMTGLY